MKIGSKIFSLLIFSAIFVILLLSIISASIETDFMSLMNAERARVGKSAVYINSNLNNAAYLHSKDMGDKNYFSHTSLDGRTFVDRIKAAGYISYIGLAENIAYHSGSADASKVFDMWKNSPGHYANMIGDYNEAGLGVYYTGKYTYYTLDLGKRSGFKPPTNSTSPPVNPIINYTNSTNPPISPPVNSTNSTKPPVVPPINNSVSLSLILSVNKTSSNYYQFFKINAKTSSPAYIYYILNGRKGVLCNFCSNCYFYLRLPLNNSTKVDVFAKINSTLINKTLILR
ncbi:Cysteine-rich secretory protein family protein [uncultured archaeon]|nr:Cysteine-rich secretory protein family protein [uncultured archaeon]